MTTYSNSFICLVLATALGVAMLPGSDSAAGESSQSDDSDASAHDSISADRCRSFVFETIHARRTVRKFRPDPVPEEHIRTILDAARMAPTSGNQQPWTFLVIQNRSRLDSLSKAAVEWYIESYVDQVAPDADQLQKLKDHLPQIIEDNLSAPVYVAVLVDSTAKYPEYVIYDGTLAAGYLMIAARALGYGTGYFTSFFPDDRMKEFFDIPGRYKLICFTPIGIPDQWPETPPKKPLDDLIVWESF